MKNKGGDGFYVRLIGRISRWPDGENVKIRVKKLGADAITLDLRTTDNKLSWWKVEDLEKDTIERMAASLISVLKSAPSKTLYIVAIPVKRLNKYLEMENSPEDAETAVADLKVAHYNSARMNFSSLRIAAKMIAEGTSGRKGNIVLKAIKRDKAVEKLKNEYEKKNLDPDKLKEWGREQLKEVNK